VVINRMCHQSCVVPPGLGENFMPVRSVEMNDHAAKRNVRRSMAIAAGFGGAMGAISLISSSKR